MNAAVAVVIALWCWSSHGAAGDAALVVARAGGVAVTAGDLVRHGAIAGDAETVGLALRDARLDERALTAIVNTIGLNCECGLDRKWMQGTMIPQKWDEDVQKRFANQLGFDPESPAIRIEMSQILAKGGKGQGANHQTQIGGTLDDLLMGYREGALNVAQVDSPPEVPSSGESAEPEPAVPKTPAVEPRKNFSFFGWMMMAGVPILVAGGVILMLGRKRDP